MRIVIRFGNGRRIGAHRGKNRRLALAAAALLTPAALTAAVLGLWRIAADLGWAGDFAIASGFFSHWQVWLVAAAALELCAHFLNRYGKAAAVEAKPVQCEKSPVAAAWFDEPPDHL
jgi:hypothetical protein